MYFVFFFSGLLLGSLYASVSCAIVMPSVCRISASTSGARNWPQLICTAGGTDTALSVGVYGLIYSYIFVDVDDTYKYIKVSHVSVGGYQAKDPFTFNRVFKQKLNSNSTRTS